MQVSNRAFKHTAVDISERNILALLHELYTGNVPGASELRGESVHRARPARGPTTAEVRLSGVSGALVRHVDVVNTESDSLIAGGLQIT